MTNKLHPSTRPHPGRTPERNTVSHKSRKYSWLSKVATIAGAALLVLSGSQAAYAEDPSGLAANLEPDRAATLNVHKYEQPEQLGENGDGTQQDTSGLTPIKDIGFTIQLIDRNEIDLRTNEGWRKAAALNGNVAAATELGFDSDQPMPDEVKTDANGLAKFAGVPVGLYLVTETDSNGYTPAVPFLVTLPITDPVDKAEWLYDVHVYPKNSKGNSKTTEDGDAIQLGDTISWTIRGDIPRGGALSGYQVVDKLDERLEYKPTAAVSFENADGVTLAPEDYVIDYVDSDTHAKYLPGKYDLNSVIVTFTKSGLLKLEEAGRKSGIAQVRIDIDSVVISLGNDGVIENDAVIYPDAPSIEWKPSPEDPEGPGVVVPPAVTKWGNIIFTKTDGKDNALAGAEFQVFLNESDALAQKNPVAVVRDADGSAIEPPQSVFKSDSNGQVRIPGLRYSTWANNGEVKEGDAGYQAYWLVETKAPAGFNLLAEPIKVEVNSMDNPVVVSGAEGGTGGELEKVVNVPKNGGFELPKTGGIGTWFLGAGSLLLALGAVMMIIRRARNQAHQN